jgi:hypothetical protein
MPWNYGHVFEDAYAENNAEQAAAQAELHSAMQNEDAYSVRAARDKLLKLRADRRELDASANQMVQSQTQPPPGFEDYRREDRDLAAAYRLTPTQFDHATGWTSDPRVSKKERIETYIRNTQRYQQLRASGYRDEGDAQGRR